MHKYILRYEVTFVREAAPYSARRDVRGQIYDWLNDQFGPGSSNAHFELIGINRTVMTSKEPTWVMNDRTAYFYDQAQATAFKLRWA